MAVNNSAVDKYPLTPVDTETTKAYCLQYHDDHANK